MPSAPRLQTRASEKLFREACTLMVGGVSSPVRAFKAVGGTPLYLSRARGPYVWDADGNRYIDFVQSFGAVMLGHGDPGLVRAVTRATRAGSVTGSPVPEEIELARWIRNSYPGMELIRFVNSGTEAAMSAVRAARGFTGRTLIVKFEGCYHGHSDGLLAKAGSGAATLSLPDSAGVPSAVVGETRVLPYNDVDALNRHFAGEGLKTSAVIVEPIAANMGVVLPDRAFLETLRRLTRSHGAVLIFDEVISGYRVRAGGAQEQFGIEPDVTCLGKVMGGGIPVGAYGGRKEIMERVAPLGPVYQAGTLSGNRVAMAAGAAALRCLNAARPYKALQSATKRIVDGITESFQRHGKTVQVAHACGMFTPFFAARPVRCFSDVLLCDKGAYSRFFHSALRHGLYLPPSQFEACFVSMCHTPSVLKAALRAWDHAVSDMDSVSAPSSPR